MTYFFRGKELRTMDATTTIPTIKLTPGKHLAPLQKGVQIPTLRTQITQDGTVNVIATQLADEQT